MSELTKPSIFITIRHADAFQDDDGRLSPLGEKQGLRLLDFMIKVRDSMLTDVMKECWDVKISLFSSQYTRAFQTAKSISNGYDDIISLPSLNIIIPEKKAIDRAIKDILQYHDNESIVVVICHGDMPAMLMEGIYKEFFDSNLSPSIEKNVNNACGYMLDVQKNLVSPIKIKT